MSRERARFWTWAGAALLCGLALRLWFVSHMAAVLGDSVVYGDIAKNLLRHGVYGFSQGSTLPGELGASPTLIRLPGYPFFLAACFRIFGMEHYNAVLYTQAVADLVTCCLAGALAGRLFGNRAALTVLWLSALCPFTASYCRTALAETLVLSTIALAFYSFARWLQGGRRYNRWLWMTAIALAGSILLRPEQTLFAAAILAAMFWSSRMRRGAGGVRAAMPIVIAAFCVILPLFPWTMRNWRMFHVFQPLVPKYANDPGELEPLGFSRWYRTWAIDFAATENVYWNYPGDRIDLGDLPPRAFAEGSASESIDLRKRTAALLADYNAGMGGGQEVNPQIDARFGVLGEERIRKHPVLYYLGLPIARVLNMTLRPRNEMMDVPLDWWNWKGNLAESTFCVVYASLNFAYIVAGVAGFVAWKRRGWAANAVGETSLPYRELAWAMAASILLRAVLLLTIDNSEPRYTLEFFPILFVWAGALFATPQTTAGVSGHGGR
ncbi:MAG: glycosyltransferase family 39 protein [Acidobacteriota bacterium]|nr:glycosyltransferase family 39 protein [Acidobacteriota bacterium]